MSRGLYQLSYGSTSGYDASFMRAWQALFAGLHGGSVDGLEIVPRVVAGGACRGGFRPFVDVAAVLAAPDAGLGRGEHGAGFDGGGEGEEALFMVFFGHGDGAHDGGDLGESFFVGGLGEGRVHRGVFLVLAGCGGLEVVKRAADDAGREGGRHFHGPAFQELEQALGMLLFLTGDLVKGLHHFHVAVFLGLAGKEGVAVAGLGFPGEGGEDVLFGLRSLEGFHGCLLVIKGHVRSARIRRTALRTPRAWKGC